MGHFITLVVAVPVMAATVTFKNGDRLTGEVLSLFEGRLIVKTEHAGEVAADWDEVAALRSDESLDLYLESGLVLEGPVMDLDGGWLGVRTEQGIVTVALPMIAGINRKPGARTSEDASGSPGEPSSAATWGGHVGWGALVAWGNSEVGTSADLHLFRRGRLHRFAASLSALYARDEDSEAGGEQALSLSWERDLDRSLYLFVVLATERDDLEQLDLRAVLAPGIGRTFWRGERSELRGEVGLAAMRRDPEGTGGRTEAEALLALQAEVDLPGRVTGRGEVYLFPSLSESEYRLRSSMIAEVPLGKRMALSAGILGLGDSRAGDDVERFDVQLRSWLSIAF